MARKKRPASAIRRLHRSLGAFAALFVIFMVLSGILINHSNGLGLDQQRVEQGFLLDWYGFGKPDNLRSFAVGDNWLSFAGSQLYLNDKPVTTLSGGTGAVFNGDLLIVSGSDELLLLDLDGNLIERLPWDSIGTSPIESIGLHENTLVTVKSAGQLWLADAELINWQQARETTAFAEWSLPVPTPETLRQTITRHYRGEGLSIERLLLDLHSGRIFGSVGIFVYDLIALTLGFLAISGLILWARSKRNGKRK